jgi:glucose-1-phosphate cytidylyltransferase
VAAPRSEAMKVVILAGGLGTRLAEETDSVPKPMVEIGGYPILWHIMRHYDSYGFREFVIAVGYKGHLIKRFLLDYRVATHSLRLELQSGDVTVGDSDGDELDWVIDVLETGLNTMTAGRVRKALPLIGNETFMMTYGDGVSNVDLDALLELHRSHGKLATMTVVRAPSHFGHMEFDGDQIVNFVEKPHRLHDWINGGFFVLEPGVADYLDEDGMWERIALEALSRDGQLMAYRHEGFWQCMDSLRDKRLLEQLWESGDAQWKTWG